MHKTPNEFYIRLHHVRPRFKNDVENVLIFMASEIAKIPPLKKNEFKARVNLAVKNYPGNSEKDEKTIGNLLK